MSALALILSIAALAVSLMTLVYVTGAKFRATLTPHPAPELSQAEQIAALRGTIQAYKVALSHAAIDAEQALPERLILMQHATLAAYAREKLRLFGVEA